MREMLVWGKKDEDGWWDPLLIGDKINKDQERFIVSNILIKARAEGYNHFQVLCGPSKNRTVLWESDLSPWITQKQSYWFIFDH